MKRCPQCEFIYEDDQSLCDMDGVLLVLDSRTLPNLHALATVPVKTQSRRNRAVPAFATLILALVLGLVYYVSTRPRAVPTTTPPASATTTAAPAPVAPVVNPTPEAQPSESPKEEEEEETKPATTKQPTVAPAPSKKTAAAKTVAVPQTKTSAQPKKDESKVGSILKKTGRILKKPFKF